MKTLALSFLVAVCTLIAMYIVGLRFFASGGGLIYPAIVAWGVGSAFALERRPARLWLHVAAIGILIAALIDLYFGVVLPWLFPPSPWAPGGPNMNLPSPPLPLPAPQP